LKRKSTNSSRKNKPELHLELRRQSVHFLGILAVPVMLYVERTAATVMLGGFLMLLIALSFYRAKRTFDARWLETFILKRERPGAFPLSGAVFFFLGAFCAFLLYSPLYAAAATAVLAVGDSASTVIGKLWGKHKLPLTGGRSWEGSAAFFAFSFVVLLLFVQPQKALLVAALSAAVEALPRLDDNFTVPIAAGLFLTLL
jgi:dolichol kinase